MFKKCLPAVLLTLSIIFTLSSLLFCKEDIPQPSGWVNDFAGVISFEYKDRLNSLISKIEEKTSTEVAVVTIDSIAPYDEKEYARLLFDNWKPGKRGKDNGVLVLLAIKERRWRIETGYGVEEILPDGRCGEIGREFMVPYFKEGKYAEGLYYGVTAITQVIAKDIQTDIINPEQIKLKDVSSKPIPIFLYFLAPLFFFIWSLPWPFVISLPFTLLFAVIFFTDSPVISILIIIGYIASVITRYYCWNKIPLDKRKGFFGYETYGSGGWSGGYGGGFGGGGFGGGSGGGGGAGGRF